MKKYDDGDDEGVRLSGESFPPQIIYKVFTAGKVKTITGLDYIHNDEKV